LKGFEKQRGTSKKQRRKRGNAIRGNSSKERERRDKTKKGGI